MDTGDYAIIVLVVVTLGLVNFVFNLRKKNMAQLEEKPVIAGDDEIAGGALDPEQFEEPDDDTLDEMESLLKDAAEAQGLDYEE